MICFRVLKCNVVPALSRFLQTSSANCSKSSACGILKPLKRPCFSVRDVRLERATTRHWKLIRSFLYHNFWPREPSVVGAWIPLNSHYLHTLTKRYCHSGDRLLAFEKIERTGEEKLVGIAIGNRVCSWAPGQLEQWAHATDNLPEKHRLSLCAHCLRAPKLFTKYGVDYLYEVEVLATTEEVGGLGLGTFLLERSLYNAFRSQYPLVQVVATSLYTAKACEKCMMSRVWSMEYADYVDPWTSRRVYFPRRPHDRVSVYVMSSAAYSSLLRVNTCGLLRQTKL